MEEDKTTNTELYESNQIDASDYERISVILHNIIKEGQIICDEKSFVDDSNCVKKT